MSHHSSQVISQRQGYDSFADHGIECRARECVDKFELQREVYNLTDAENVPPLIISEYTRSLETACRMTTGSDLAKAALWRWLLFFALYFPLGLVGLILARFLTFLVWSYGLGGDHVRISESARN
jgi:hypothetical protein